MAASFVGWSSLLLLAIGARRCSAPGREILPIVRVAVVCERTYLVGGVVLGAGPGKLVVGGWLLAGDAGAGTDVLGVLVVGAGLLGVVAVGVVVVAGEFGAAVAPCSGVGGRLAGPSPEAKSCTTKMRPSGPGAIPTPTCVASAVRMLAR